MMVSRLLKTESEGIQLDQSASVTYKQGNQSIVDSVGKNHELIEDLYNIQDNTKVQTKEPRPPNPNSKMLLKLEEK